MQKGISFVIVFTLTTLAWLIVGYVIRLVFSTLSLVPFVCIGLAAGLLLATLLAFMHEDTAPLARPASPPEATNAPESESPAIRPNPGPDPQSRT